MDNQANQVCIQVSFTKKEVVSNIITIDKQVATFNQMIKALSTPDFSTPEKLLLHSLFGSKTKTGTEIVGFIENEISILKGLKIKLLQAELDLREQTKEAAQS